jgi:hypothetical protein
MPNTDKAGIQFHILNRSKGAAVWVHPLPEHGHICFSYAQKLPGTSSADRQEALQDTYARNTTQLPTLSHPCRKCL